MTYLTLVKLKWFTGSRKSILPLPKYSLSAQHFISDGSVYTLSHSRSQTDRDHISVVSCLWYRMILLRLPLSSLLWSLLSSFLQIIWLPMLLLLYLFSSDDQCVIHFEGAECTLLVFLSMKHSTRKWDFAIKWKELQCAQEDVAVRFLKQSPQTVKGAGHIINTVY